MAMTQQQANDKRMNLLICAILVNAYQPPNLPSDPLACENLKITQFERMESLLQQAMDPANEALFSTPAAIASDPVGSLVANPSGLQALAKILAPILSAFNPAIGAVAATVANLPPVALPSASSMPK